MGARWPDQDDGEDYTMIQIQAIHHERIEVTAEVVLILATSLLIAVSAYVRVVLPFTPVPVTAQTLTVLLSGALLGSRRGTLAVLAYLAQGIIGLPVFAGGTRGLSVLLGPTGGYLVGFTAAAFVTGVLAERGWLHLPLAGIAAMVLGNLTIYAVGLPWLSSFVGGKQAFALGFLPFVVGDLAKMAVAAILLAAVDGKSQRSE
jgi:biotin transport system substrate-specific component